MPSSVAGQIVGVVGWKDAGKTPVVEGLVRFLVSEGFTVGTVKHVHEGVTLEPPATDSSRHLEAGAVRTVIVAPDLTVTLSGDEVDLDGAVARHLLLCDYVVVEGFKRASIPKIAVVPEGEDMPPDLENVIAIVGAASKGHPTFGFEEIEALGRFLLEQQVLRPPAQRTVLLVNGKPVRLNEFVQSSLAGVIRGFVASLKDVEQPQTIQLTLKSPFRGHNT